MLQNIRDRSQGLFSVVIVSIISFTFVIWGVHNYIESGHTNAAAKVNGVSITQGQVTSAYERLRSQEKLQLGSEYKINPAIEKELKQQALNQLISSEILSEAAHDQGLRFTDQQLANAVANIPAFQYEGKFSPARFKEVLDSTLYTERSFLNDMRHAMLVNQMRMGVINSAFALPNEVDQAIKLVNQKRDITYAILPFDSFLKDIHIPEATLKAYYDQHQEDFKTPEQVSLEYIELSLPDLKSHQPVSQAELEQYYKENLNRYIAPGKSEASPFEKVKEQVKQAAMQQKAEQAYADASERLTNLAYTSPGSLKVAAEGLALAIKTTGFFGKEGNKSSDITVNPKVLEAAFSNDVLIGGNNSSVIELTPERAIILRIHQHKPASIMPLAAVRNQIENRLKEDEARNRAKREGETLVKSLQQGQASLQKNIQWTTRTSIGRYDPKINSAILNNAFHMPKPSDAKKPTIAGFVTPTGDYAILKLTSVHEGTLASNDASTQQRAFKEQIENSTGQLDYGLYVQSLFARAKLDIKS